MQEMDAPAAWPATKALGRLQGSAPRSKIEQGENPFSKRNGVDNHWNCVRKYSAATATPTVREGVKRNGSSGRTRAPGNELSLRRRASSGAHKCTPNQAHEKKGKQVRCDSGHKPRSLCTHRLL